MSSRSRSSRRNSPRLTSDNHNPKFEVEEDEREAYCEAACGVSPSWKEVPFPKRGQRSFDACSRSRVSPNYLAILREFYRVPDSVTFRIPTGDESAANPPEGFFTCYEAFLTYGRMWFPIPSILVRALHRFELSISQLNVQALENWIGVIILSYEFGIELTPDDFEGLWLTRPTGNPGSYGLVAKKDMAIIQGVTSNSKDWFERFFFVKIDGESVEENCLHLFPKVWNFTRRNNLTAHMNGELFVKRDLLRKRPFFWNSFTLDRIRSAVELHRCQGSSHPTVAEIPVETPAPRRRHRSRKGKETDCGEASNFNPREWDGPSEVPLPNGFFDDLPPAFTTNESLEDGVRQRAFVEGSQRINEGLRVFGDALDVSFRESRIAHFKAQEAERELFRFRKEVEEQNRRQAALHSRALVRAERRGKRSVAAEMARRATLFAAEFESFKEAQDFVGDFRECRGSVANLYKSQNPDFSFDSEITAMKGFMDECAHAESMVPPVEDRVWKLWDPIEVSADTVENGVEGNAVEDVHGANEEVDQPANEEVDQPANEEVDQPVNEEVDVPVNEGVDQPISPFGYSLSGLFYYD